MRLCGTPGCTKKDFHLGYCSNELQKRRRTESSAPMSTHNVLSTNERNQFQHGMRFSVSFPSHMRLCGTPGCTKKDFHVGCCSTELQKRRRPESSALMSTHNVFRTNEGNQFQHGIAFVQACMKDQLGVVLQLPGDLHPTMHTEESFKATVTNSLSGDMYVASVFIDDTSTPLSLRPIDLVRHDVCVHWNKLGAFMMSEHKAALAGKEHDASARRVHCFVDTLRSVYRTASDQMVLSLDGNGENREAFADKFRDLDTHMIPQFLTYEMDPAVALSQQLLYGKHFVTFTGAMKKEKFSYGCDGARASTPSGIEYLITNRTNSSGVYNKLIDKQCCENVIGLNLDYCGGVLGGLDFEASKRTLVNLLARLPRLVVLCLTFGKRQRPGLKYDFEKYAPVPYGFRIVQTFDKEGDNQRVVSRIYVRLFDIPRTLSVPVTMWNLTKCKSMSRSLPTHYRCVIKSIEPQTGSHILYSVDDDTDDHVFNTKVSLDYYCAWAISDPNVLNNHPTDKNRSLKRLRKEVETQYATILAHIDHQIDTGTYKKKTYCCRRCGMPKKGHICSV